jgi:hypothetical protein
MTILNHQLRDRYVSPQLRFYFDQKLAPRPIQEVDELLEEALKFLSMASFIVGIDDVWHYWILETIEYQKLCLKLPSGKYIHHTSNDFLNFSEKDNAAIHPDFTHQVAILSSYVTNFGPFEISRIKYWPVAEQVMRCCHMDINSLNAWLVTAGQNYPADSLPLRVPRASSRSTSMSGANPAV